MSLRNDTAHTAGAATRRVPRREWRSLSESEWERYTEDERDIIDLYHDIVVAADPTWLPVNRFSENVSAAIADWFAWFRSHEEDSLTDLFSAAADDAGSVLIRASSKRTLIRLLRDNVNGRIERTTYL